ncbi:hypothetical protein EBR96_02160 [bacterium]|nr:hypothetical protein [bacterium]
MGVALEGFCWIFLWMLSHFIVGAEMIWGIGCWGLLASPRALGAVSYGGVLGECCCSCADFNWCWIFSEWGVERALGFASRLWAVLSRAFAGFLWMLFHFIVGGGFFRSGVLKGLLALPRTGGVVFVPLLGGL